MDAFIWPLTVAIIAVVFLFMFKRPITGLINRITELGKHGLKVGSPEDTGAEKPKSQADEGQSKKLEIIEAVYRTHKHSMDVTHKLNQRISNNTLDIVASNAIAGDPHPGFVKDLVIKYKVNGKEHTRTFPEKAKVVLP
jgi:hypothetical protein